MKSTSYNPARMVAQAIAIFGAANAAASAVEAHRQPRRQDLQTLGIDPAQMSSMSRR